MEQLLSLNVGLELLQFENISLQENICCPRCQSQNLTKDGKNKEDNRQRYKCKECGRAFIEKLPLEKKQRKIKRDIACPQCNSHYLYTAGKQQEKQRYACTNCKKRFIENPKTTVVYEKYNCPICQGNETVRVGKDNSGEKQRFFCQKCQRQFTEKSAFVQLGRSLPQWNTPEEMFNYDIWDVRVLGLKPTISSKRSVIKFSTIQIEWLKQAAKDWIKYKAATDETSILVHRVTSIKKFNDFLVENCLNTLQKKSIEKL